jgi:hypothetical protein
MSSDGEMGETTAVRTDYRGLIWPFAAVGALLLAWTVWWFVAAGQVERRAEETLADLRARGWIAEVSGLSVRGWPFRLFVTTTEARIVSPRGSGIAARGLRAEAAAYDLNKWVIAAPDGIALIRGDLGEVRVTGRAVRASVVRLMDGAVPRTTIELLEPKFASSPGSAPFPLAGAEVVDLYLRPADGDRAEFLVRVENGEPAPGSALERLTGAAPLTLRAEGAVPAPRWPLEQVEALRAELRSGDVFAQAASERIAVDGAGRLAGDVALKVEGAQAAIAALGAFSGVDPRAAMAASVLLGDRAVETDLVFEGGRSRLAGVDLGVAPRVR